MKKQKKFDIIELYVRDLDHAYHVFKRTSEILELNDREESVVDAGLRQMEELLDRVKKCESLKEMDKYIDVDAVIEHYKKNYDVRKRELI